MTDTRQQLVAEPAKPCVHGCTIRFRHLEPCPVPDGTDAAVITVDAAGPVTRYNQPAHADVEYQCRGCKPRDARHGLVCTTCHRRLSDWLMGEHGLVWTYGWLGDNLAAGGSSEQREWQRPSKVTGSPAPLVVAIHDCRIALWWRVEELEQSVRDLFNLSRRTDPFEIAAGCQFLSAWLPQLESDRVVDYAIERLEEVMRDAGMLAPWRDKPRRLPFIPCPHCERLDLVIYSGDEDVTCQTCGTIIEAQDYRRWEYAYAHAAEGDAA